MPRKGRAPEVAHPLADHGAGRHVPGERDRGHGPAVELVRIHRRQRGCAVAVVDAVAFLVHQLGLPGARCERPQCLALSCRVEHRQAGANALFAHPPAHRRNRVLGGLQRREGDAVDHLIRALAEREQRVDAFDDPVDVAHVGATVEPRVGLQGPGNPRAPKRNLPQSLPAPCERHPVPAGEARSSRRCSGGLVFVRGA